MLSIHLFGHLRLFFDGRSHRFQGLPKTTLLLVYLLLHRPTAVPRLTLAFLLWDDVPESEARANLRCHLHDARRALPPGQPWLLSDGKSVQWNPNDVCWLALAEFEQLCQDNGRLAEAVTLYTGDLLSDLSDLYEDWLAPERERLQALYLSALARLGQREQAQGDLVQALAYARQLLAVDLLREDVVRQVLLLRSAVGDQAGALQFYQQFKERRTEEFDVALMAETTAVYQSILNTY
jgi:DNA-binding SARP family transcriptional activator